MERDKNRCLEYANYKDLCVTIWIQKSRQWFTTAITKQKLAQHKYVTKFVKSALIHVSDLQLGRCVTSFVSKLLKRISL